MKKIIYIKAKPKRRIVSPKIISLGMMIGGFLLILGAVWPILSFNILTVPKFSYLLNPVSETSLTKPSYKRQGFSVNNGVEKPKDIKVAEAQEENILSEQEADYTKASVWFPKKPAIKISQLESKDYTLTIPKLKIDKAHVVIGGEDLEKGLVHYGGTAYPGEYGNTVIFGHSTLPYFFNPKDYKTIFSWLPSLNEGDEIYVNYEGVTYKYKIIEMRVVMPDDVSILEQKYDDSYLSLITCVPPGTYNHRLWVKAKLDKI